MRNLLKGLKGSTVVVKTDQGGEFVNKELGQLLEELGIEHSTSASSVSTGKQNRKAEKTIQDIICGVRTYLCVVSQDLKLWGEALNKLPVLPV